METNNKGIMYLSGGGNVNKTPIIDTHFLKNLPKKEILFIPVAKTLDLLGYEACYDWLTSKIRKLSEDHVHISMVLDFNKYINLNQVAAIYIGGGNTYKLLKLMNESGFSSILKKYVQDGGIVYGASAGAVLMGKDISTYIEEKYLEENEKYNYTLKDGLSLVGDYSILAHYQEGDDEKVKKYFKSNNNSVIAIPEGSGLIVKDNCMTIIGDEAVSIFQNDGILKRFSPNTVISMYPSAFD